MSQNENKLDFRFSYNELVSQTFEKEVNLTRDLADLTPRGITAARLTDFATLRDSFVAIPSDETMVALISIKKNERDDAAEPLRIAIREVQGIAANTFGKGSAQHKTFLSKTLSELDAEGLYMLAPNVVAQGTTFMTQMSAKGLTAAMLTNITTLSTNLKPKIKYFNTAEANQLLTTQNRHKIANDLYKELSEMCEAAIVYYTDRNPLKASIYVIYDEGKNSQTRNGTIDIGQIAQRDFEGITNESIFKMKAFGGNDLLMFFSNSPSGNNKTKSVNVVSNAVDFTIATAADLGYDASGGYVFFCILNSGAEETGYRVVMEE